MNKNIPKPEVETAKWVYVKETDEYGNEYGYYRCSNCYKTESEGFYQWCGLCGAYMTNSKKILRDMQAGKDMPEVSHTQRLPFGVKRIRIEKSKGKCI